MKNANDGKKKRSKLFVYMVVTALIAVFAVPLMVLPFTYYPTVLALRARGDRGTEPENYGDVVDATRIERDLRYTDSYGGATLDIISPKERGDYPLVVYFHGGFYVGGDKKDCEAYCRLIAQKGYVVANVNYALAPKYRYPAPLIQANEAVDYLMKNKTHFNFGKVFVAGECAGAHLAAQYAAAVTNPLGADVIPVLQESDLAGVAMVGGFFDVTTVRDSYMPFLSTALWAYTGEKKYEEAPSATELNVLNRLSSDFPPAFLLCGQYDMLSTQSSQLRYALVSYGVPYGYNVMSEDGVTLNHGFHRDFSQTSAFESVELLSEFFDFRS